MHAFEYTRMSSCARFQYVILTVGMGGGMLLEACLLGGLDAVPG